MTGENTGDCRTDYEVEAQQGVSLSDYPNIQDGTTEFPKTVWVAFAVCRTSCGTREFIVDGSTQICQRCGKMMFRIESKQYVLAEQMRENER